MDLKNTKGNFVEREGTVKQYLEDIRKYEPLTQEKENELINRFRETGDVEAFHQLINCNQRFVFAVAKRYASDDRVMDLVNEGNIGLMTAITAKNEKTGEYLYDINKGVRFLSYAVWYIRREIYSYLSNRDMLVRKQNNLKTVGRVNKIKNKFYASTGRYPSMDEIIEILDKEYGIKIMEESDLYDLRMDSLNINYDDEDASAFENSSLFTAKTSVDNDYVKDTDTEYNNEATGELLSCLDEREKEVIKRAFGMAPFNKEYTNAESGEDMGLSGERVRQIKEKALKKMRALAVEIA